MNRSFNENPFPILPRVKINRSLLFGSLIIGALLAFELFNYSTTEYSLGDLLGNLNFLGIQWSTILSIAFCGIDFAGLARIFTPEIGDEEPKEVWYLFGAWLLAATMNAMLTWWGVSVAILNHAPSTNVLIPRETVIMVVPVFVAVMVWLIRILIIGTFSVAGDRLLHEPQPRRSRSGSQANNRIGVQVGNQQSVSQPNIRASASTGVGNYGRSNVPQPVFKAAQKPVTKANPVGIRPEPTYVPISTSSTGRGDND